MELPERSRFNSRNSMNSENSTNSMDLIAIAKVTKTRGLRGEVVAELLTDFPERFDGLVEEFNGHTGRTLSPHDVWRVVAKLAK